jgi:cytochrome c oxidase subunit 1
VLGFAQLIMVYNIVQCVRGGKKATDRVWEGAEGLEWTLPSPPPYHSFTVQPVVK